MPALERLGLENLNQIEAAIGRYGSTATTSARA
jgi:hypothetical protein